jgi:hypothetical protein
MGLLQSNLEFLRICLECVSMLSGQKLAIAFLVAVVLTGLCWFGATHYTRLWNTQFHTKAIHHWFCGIAAAIAFVFVIVWFALAYLGPVAAFQVLQWGQKMEEDSNDIFLQQKAFMEDYAKKKGRWDEFKSQFKSNEYPNIDDPSLEAIARLTSEALLADFARTHAFYYAILVPSAVTEAYIQNYREFRAKDTGAAYPLSGDPAKRGNYGVPFCVGVITKDLESKSPRIVFLARLALIALFVLVEAVPFLLIGYAATKDIKAERSTVRRKLY